ncbi:MAG: phospholipase [Pseudomonadota bacterium]
MAGFSFLLLAVPGAALAWDDHSLMARPALAKVAQVANAPYAEVEPIERFLAAEEQGLVTLLSEEEAWAAAHVPTWPALPPALAFQAGGDAATLRTRFLEALRMAPDARLALYVKAPPGAAELPDGSLPWAEVTTLHNPGALGHALLLPLAEGERIAPLEVLVSACDEPDFGLDLGLWEDNASAWGPRYGLGAQPFGDPVKEYGSQAPMHMGLYHEASIVYLAAASLQRTYPEVRVHQLQTLARFAFGTGHDYWGWRFTGWALHYVQDLTMPYHARVLPGVSVPSMLWVAALDMIGFHDPYDDALRLVSNRHMVVEHYVREVLESGDAEAAGPLRAALADTRGDLAVRPWDDRSLREVIGAAAVAQSDGLDAALTAWFPAQLVSDPDYVVDETEPDINVHERLLAADPAVGAALEPAFTPLLAAFGAASRSFLLSVRPEDDR